MPCNLWDASLQWQQKTLFGERGKAMAQPSEIGRHADDNNKFPKAVCANNRHLCYAAIKIAIMFVNMGYLS